MTMTSRGSGRAHEVLGTPMGPPFPAGAQVLYVAMGCFWGAERIFWQLPGVITTAAGYMGGQLPGPSYEQVCTGATGHAETVLIVYDPAVTTPVKLLTAFWENHDPTTANRQGNDIGTQYRSAIFWTTPEQHAAAEATREAFQRELDKAGAGAITTQIQPATAEAAPEGVQPAGPFYYAEDYHQQYLHKNPRGYCNHGPNGFTCRL